MGQTRSLESVFFIYQWNNKNEFNKQVTHSCQEVIKSKAIYKN